MVGIGRAVEVVPLLHVPLLTSDEQDALSREDEEALLVRLTVIHAGRLAGPEDSDVEAELRETSSLTLTEPREDAHLVRLAPDGIAGVDDEPAVAGCLPPVLRPFERRLGNPGQGSQPS